MSRDVQVCTWTPKVRRLIAFFIGLGNHFTYFGGLGKGQQS